MQKLYLIVLFTSIKFSCLAQVNTTLFGFCFRPIFSSKFLRTDPKDYTNNTTNFKLAQNSGYTTGAVVRRGITKRLSFETGILYTKRNYNFSITDSAYSGSGDFSIISYEIPINALVFIQLDKQLWMNVALGGSLDVFPSDIFTSKNYYLNYAARKSKINSGVIANIGLEYRTKKSGTIYLGTSYHRSMNTIYNSLIEYYPTNDYKLLPKSTGRTTLQGDYLTFDVRYYFHEDPEKKKSRKKKK